MPSSGSNASDSGKDVVKAKSESILDSVNWNRFIRETWMNKSKNTDKRISATKIASRLSPEQLARKRANDRESQRAIRARNKDLIASLQREVHELRSRDDARAVQELLRRNGALESELRLLRQSIGIPTPHHQPAQHLDGSGHLASLNAFSTNSYNSTSLPTDSKYSIPRRLENPSSVWISGQYGSDPDPNHQQQQPPQNSSQISQVPLNAPQHDTWCSPDSMSSATAEISDVSTRMEGLFPAAAHTSMPAPSSGGLGLVPKSHMSVPSGPDAVPNPGSPPGCYGDPHGLTTRPPSEGFSNLHYFMSRGPSHGGVAAASHPPLHQPGLIYRG
ncbi:hypothetical protein E4U13_001803 [Claviceps humidiphila]|uniref:BZIP domain-containing protein n=1 Tax=Claviceps humidiphila TaxID=1294629 RepID=A0A9P7TUX7_9HYPO|nr:hypothetical protein E4U13_001803 [Claviceps humidiphila]